MKTIFTHLITPLLFSLTIVFFVGCGGNTEKSPPEVDDETAVLPDTSLAQVDSAEVKIDSSDLGTEETAPPTPPANGSDGLASRTVSENKLTTVLETIARDMEARKLAYVSSLGQDCSGIFHQLKDSIQVRIPALADQSKYIYPSFSVDRNSRQIADWYYRHNNLLIVQDAMAERNKIRPGCVMFFGRTDEQYSSIGIDLLTNPGKFVHDGTKGKIMHVAVVTSVEKDEAGSVTAYTMMHGRNKRHNASRSGGNTDGPGESVIKAHAKFPFGNWNQQWVAMAHIETPK